MASFAVAQCLLLPPKLIRVWFVTATSSDYISGVLVGMAELRSVAATAVADLSSFTGVIVFLIFVVVAVLLVIGFLLYTRCNVVKGYFANHFVETDRAPMRDSGAAPVLSTLQMEWRLICHPPTEAAMELSPVSAY